MAFSVHKGKKERKKVQIANDNVSTELKKENNNKGNKNTYKKKIIIKKSRELIFILKITHIQNADESKIDAFFWQNGNELGSSWMLSRMKMEKKK